MPENIFIEYFFFVQLFLAILSFLFLGLRFFNKFSDERILKFLRIIFFIGLFLVCLKVWFLFAAQYRSWLGSYFLPPYQPIGYFLQYSWTHFAKQPVFDIGLGIFFFFLIWLGTKISGGRFFYGEEKYSGGLAILLNHWPVNILVFFLVLLAGILFSLARRVFKGRGQGGAVLISFRYFWPMVGLGLLFLGDILVNFLGLGILTV